MITVVCPACNETIEASDSQVGKREKCPQCGRPVIVKKSNSDIYPSSTKKRPLLKWAVCGISIVVVVLIVGYILAIQFGPETWRIGEKERIALSVIKNFQTRVEIGMKQGDYNTELGKTVAELRPYLESDRPRKECPEFGRWIFLSMIHYSRASDKLNKPIDDSKSYKISELQRELNVSNAKIEILFAKECIINADLAMNGKPIETEGYISEIKKILDKDLENGDLDSGSYGNDIRFLQTLRKPAKEFWSEVDRKK